MILVKLRGGLGNQMFQYATGRMLACATGTQLKLDLSWFTLPPSDTTPRKYELGTFNLPENIASFAEIACVRVASGLNIFRYRYQKEASFEYDQSIQSCGDRTYLDGYWQSYKYFISIRDTLLADFTLKHQLEGMNKERAEQILQDEYPVAMHIRRGDYVSKPNNESFHGVCSSSYYLQAMEVMRSMVPGAHFYVFSDDPPWVRENIFSDGMSIVDHNTAEAAPEDLRLMALCKHHIIANSTFSWWGAWLCRNAGKIIIAPKRWFNDPRMSADDLIPETWIRI